MKRDECEKAIRGLCHQWAIETGVSRDHKADPEPSVYKFKTWMHQNGHGRFLEFRTLKGYSADEWIEIWFAQEMKQAWRY